MTTPRSAPCPCGSGLKYKRCHGSETPPGSSPDEIAWQKVRHAIDSNSRRLTEFVLNTYGKRGLSEAWSEFTGRHRDLRFDTESYLYQLFMSWYQCVWTPNPFDTTVSNSTLHDRTPLSVFLERHGATLNPILREYLESVESGPLSYWEIMQCEPGRGFRVRDMFTKEEHFVFERSASRSARAGDIFWGFLGHAHGVWLVEGVGGCALGPSDKISIIELREMILKGRDQITPEELADWDMELQELYLTLAEQLMNPVPPTLTNTDGDELEPQAIIFDVKSAQRAFDALKHLNAAFSDDSTFGDAAAFSNDAALGDNAPSVSEDAEYEVVRNPKGQVKKAEINWTQKERVGSAPFGSAPFGGVSLGRLEIEGTQLTAHVNSAERGSRIRALIEEALGSDIVWQRTDKTDLQQELAKHRANPQHKEEPDDDDPMNYPEVRAQMQAMMAEHYARWVDDKLPALGGQSPRQAVRDRAGREKVEALIADLERMEERRGRDGLDPSVIAKLRTDLGLKRAKEAGDGSAH